MPEAMNEWNNGTMNGWTNRLEKNDQMYKLNFVSDWNALSD